MGCYPDRFDSRVFRTKETYEIAKRKRGKGYSFRMHGHDYYEIDIILSGDCTFVVNGMEYQRGMKSLSFVSPFDLHSLKSETGIEYYNIMFYEECISDEIMMLLRKRDIPIMVNLSSESYKRVIEMCEMLVSEEKRNDYQKNYYSTNLLECILIEIMRADGKIDGESKEVYGGKNVMMSAVFKYINENFHTVITLSDIAAEIGVTNNYMSKKFKMYAGVGFQDYLTGIRCKYAKNLICSSDKRLSDICFESGFNSFSQFERSFKKCVGKSPKAFREEMKKL